MNIMLIGSGGREHALAWSLRKNPSVDTLWALPGNAGIEEIATCVPIGATELDRIVEFAKGHDVDFVVVAPDDPLAMGLVDRLHEIGISCFGPDAKAARLESSKAFAKDLMYRHGIPTAAFKTCRTYEQALEYLRTQTYPVVIKADGLALGKGVVIAQDKTEAEEAIRGMMLEGRFGASGDTVVVEEFLTGPEVSVLTFTDGKTVVPMVSSMDHKRAGTGDTGLNTGGMGTIAPNPYYTEEIAALCMERIFLPTVDAMRQEGCPFAGCLYFGLMLTPDGPKVIEYNCRFGDPEAQVVLPLLESDLLTAMQAVENGTLAETEIRFSSDSACCVVMASGGYPASYEKGKPITFDGTDRLVFHAGTRRDQGRIVTNGGRVLGVVAVRPSLAQAIDAAYEGVSTIHFDNAMFRKDIGAKALEAAL